MTVDPITTRPLHPVDAQGNFDADQAAAWLGERLQAGDLDAVRAALPGVLAVDLADMLSRLPPQARATLLPLIPGGERAQAFGYLPLELQTSLVAKMPRARVVELLGLMSSDERADLYNTLPPDRRERLLPALAHAEREDIRRLASHPPDSVGAIMTSEYAALAATLSAGEAIAELRRVAPDTETIYNAYIIDPQRRLKGVVSLRRLILADPDMPLITSLADGVDPDLFRDRDLAAGHAGEWLK